MTNETKHTPTPWRYHCANIFDFDGRSIANTIASNFCYSEDIANAAHIVKCVNMHDELVEVLQWIADNSMCECAVFASNEALEKAGAL